VDFIGWVVVGLLAAVTGELNLPGRNPGGMTLTLLLWTTGALLGRIIPGLLGGAEATDFTTLSIVWAAVGALVLLALRRRLTVSRPRLPASHSES
jgi:uncharacterized membrane protein YeaQ/YmgE (transglycosylase-associated protein family)